MNRYITTTLPYVNADPHIGFALEVVQADAVARTWRLEGDKVFFNAGTDEHGQKIWEAAEKGGEPVQAYVDRYSEEVRKLGGALAWSFDAFVRTTDPAHIRAAQEMWRRCEAAGDIYKKSYSGRYCVGCEAYKTERELSEGGRCLVHPALELQTIEEENWFFRLSKYGEYLKEYLSREESVAPAWRRQEALAFVEAGLEDFSISRQKEKLAWGVPVPGDDSQVMYVWFDALTNYISTLGWPEDTDGAYAAFWEGAETVQTGGKDQIRFQSIMWQAMLRSAGLPPTKRIFYHGFITSGGERMSKSLGNVISPYDLVAKYGTDATRWLLLAQVHPTEDSDVTWAKLDERYTADLVNGIGNQVARVMQLAETHLSQPVVLSAEDTKVEPAFLEQVKGFRFDDATALILDHVAKGDAFMTEREPFKKVKSEDPSVVLEGKADIERLVRHIAKVAVHLAPLMPSTSEAILDAALANRKPANLFPRLT